MWSYWGYKYLPRNKEEYTLQGDASRFIVPGERFFIFLFLELGIHVIEDFKIISPPPKKKNWLAFLNSGFFQPLYSTLRQCLFTSTVIVRKL